MPSAVQAVAASVWVERTPAGNVVGKWLACASDATGQRLLAGDNSGRLWISADCGVSWSQAGASAGGANRNWQACASDADGSTLVAGVYDGRLYVSHNAGINWTEACPAGNVNQKWKAVACDADGSTLVAAAYVGRLYRSTDAGVTWTELRQAGDAVHYWQACTSSEDGAFLAAAVLNGRLYLSRNAGIDWAESRPAGDADGKWKACASDADASTLVAVVDGGRLYVSHNAGINWTEARPVGDVNQNWQTCASDADGSNIVVGVNGGSVWTSSDGGATWSDAQPAGVTAAAWQCCASSADGSRLVAGAYEGRLYTGLTTWSLSYASTAGGVITTGANGNISPSGDVTVNHGSSQSFTINPGIGYHVQDVLVDGSSVGAVTTYTFTNVIANHTIAASFGINSYVLTADATGSGSVTKSPDQTSYDHGTSVQLTATPATGWHFVGWSGDFTGSGSPATVTIDGNKTITAAFAIDTFTVTPSAGSNGSISPATPQTMDYDGSLTFIMTPTTGYHVQDVFVDTVSVGAVTSYTFMNLTEHHTIAVTFAINPITISTYTLTYAAGANGSISGASPQTVNYGASGSAVTAVPNTGYHFVQWSDGNGNAARTDTNVAANINVSASFAINTYTIVASAGANGSISPSGDVTVNHGSSQSFTINPSTGYHVLDVLVDGSSVSAVTSYTFTNIRAAHTISVTFAINPITISTYTVTYTAGANGTISGTSPQTVNHGASGTAVTATPDAGYHFVSWSDGVATAARTDTNVTANINATASFAIDTFTVTPSAGANGAIDPSGSVSVNSGSNLTFTINPGTGYHVQGVLVDGSSMGAVSSYTFTNVTANHTIAVTFAINPITISTYTVTYTAGANGTISGTSPQTVNQGANSTAVTATPDAGYHFVSWSDGVATAARTDTNVTANINATASFAVDTFAITASAGANGSIDPSGSMSVNYGSTQSFTITPAAGYHVQGVLVDGSSMGAVSSYTFTNVTANHTIAVTFAINPITISTYTVTYTADANGTISGTSPQTVNQGANSTAVTATPDAGYHFVSWSDGVATAARTDTNVTVNVNVSASFAININIHRYTLTANVSGSGSVAKSPDQPSYTHGTSVQLMATPATGWHFVGWSGDLSGTTNPATITMDVSKTVTATYAPLPHPVSRHTMVLTIDIKTMTVDGARVTLDAPAALLEDRTLVPLRALVEHLGGTISWNAKTRQVILKTRGATMILTIGKSTALVNGKLLAIDPKNSKVVPILSSGRTMLPLRFVSENLGLQVEWDAKTRTITVNWED